MDKVLVLLGATATGKSALALAIAPMLSGEILNADALQLYRGLDIGTAKPSKSAQATVRHHLLDLFPPEEPCSAAVYAREAHSAIREVASRGALPMLVGGSGFYLQAALDGLSEIPPSAPEVRERLRRRLGQEGLATLTTELVRADPESARRLAPGDTQRILRALEVLETTGVPLSAWHRRAPIAQEPVDALRIGLTLPRALLYDRIEARVLEMVAAGWIGEIRSLLDSGVPPAAPAFQAIGYRQLIAHLEGRSSLDEAVGETVKATRRYAKRQETWFRRDSRITWFDARDADSVRNEVRIRLAGRGVGADE